MTVRREVLAVERRLDGVEHEPVRAEGHVQLEGLAAVAQIERAGNPLLRRGESLQLELMPRGALHLGEQLARDREALAQRPHARPDVVVLDVGREEAERREVPGVPRHEHPRDSDLLGQCERVHGPGAAVGDQREIAGVVPALDRDLADRGGHPRDGDRDDPLGERLVRHRPTEAPAEIGDGPLGAPGVERDAAAEAPGGPDAAEHDVRVGDRRLGAAQSVGGRARRSSGAPRPDLKAAVHVEPRDRAAAGADAVHVELGNLDGESAEHAVGRRQRREIADQADVGRGAAHVVGDEVPHAGGGADEARLAHAAGRAREDRLDRQAARRLGRHHAAARRDGENAVSVAGGAQLLLEPGEVAVHEGLQIGVEHRRREALELAVLGDDVGRAGHGQRRVPALRRVGHRPLVRRVQVGVEEADRERLGAGAHRRVERALDARPIERHQDGAVGREPLDDLEAVLALDDRLRAHEGGHEERGDIALGAADLDQVAEAGGRENGHARAVPLEDGVGADGRAVDEPPHVAARDAERPEPGHDGGGLVPRLGRHLGDDDAAGGLVDRAQIGEGAADVDPDDEHLREMIASGKRGKREPWPRAATRSDTSGRTRPRITRGSPTKSS